MRSRSGDWPARADAIAAARERFRDWGKRGARVLVAPHGDIDGLAAGALAIRALERIGAVPIPALPGKGEHVHTPAMQARLREARADGLGRVEGEFANGHPRATGGSVPPHEFARLLAALGANGR